MATGAYSSGAGTRELERVIGRRRLLVEGCYTIDVYKDVIRRLLREVPEELGEAAAVFAPCSLGREHERFR